VTERRPVFELADLGEPTLVRLAGPVTALREPEHGPFRQLRRRPEEVRGELAGETVLAYATWRPLNKRHTRTAAPLTPAS
jgi:ATP sulfurylase